MNTNKDELLGSPEKFYGKIRFAGNSRVVTIPKSILEVNGWDEGKDVIVWIKGAEK